MNLGFLPIYRRELRSFLTSPAMYVVVALFFFLSGLIFFGSLMNFSRASSDAEYRNQMGIEEYNFTVLVVRELFFALNFLMVFLAPLITMRLLAEEKRSGTFELLQSLPFTDWNIVLGKFLSAFTVMAGMLILSGYYILVMMRFGAPELPVVLVALAGSLLAAAAFTAVGLFASSITENQIVAALLAFVTLLGIFLVGEFMDNSSRGLARMLELLSLRYHTDQFARGLLRLEDVAYFVVLIVTFLFLTARTLEVRRYRI